MKCQEVMEYMQRSLDEDLNEQEHEQMQKHLHDCESCMLMYERLSRLSDELINLPKVTPPMSIVDSILPQLNELEPKTAQQKPSKITPIWRSPLFRTLGGTAVAGVLILAMVFNGQGIFQSKQADDGVLMHHEAEKSPMELNQMDTSSSYGLETTNILQRMAPAASMDSASEPELIEEQNTMDKPVLDTPAAPPAKKEAVGDIKNPQEDIQIMDFKDQSGHSVPDPNDKLDTGATSLGSPNELGEAFHITKNQAEQEREERFTLQGQLDVNQHDAYYLSPDAQYSAFVEENEAGLQLILVDHAGERIYASPAKKSGIVTKLEWSEDSKFVTYEIDDGENHTVYVIDVITRQETQI